MQLHDQMRKPVDAFTPWYLHSSPNRCASTIVSCSAATSSMLDCPSPLDYSCPSHFSDCNSSWTSHHDEGPLYSASSCFSSNASLVSPSLRSATTCSFWTGTRPSLDYARPARHFTPPTAKFNDLLDRVAHDHAPWSGVVTSKDAWYPINDVASQQNINVSPPASQDGASQLAQSEWKAGQVEDKLC